MDFNFIIYESAGSTNDIAKLNISLYETGDVIFTDNQTAGKGRLGKQWTVPQGQSAALSIVLRDVPISAAQMSPLIAGMAAAKAIENLCGEKADLKWPNDVLLNNKKVCGILCETVISGGKTDLVVGIGINLTQRENYFSEQGLEHAASLYTLTGKTVAPLPAARKTTECFGGFYSKLLKEGFDTLKDEYTSRCLTLGRDVLVNGEAAYTLDIDCDGSLICRFADGIKNVNASEVSVRGIYGYV